MRTATIEQVRGLSPRTRGKRRRRELARPSHGPIPADAGETTGRRFLLVHTGAYPRGRGGNVVCRGLFQRGQGLSPRTRGKPVPPVPPPPPPGPIPADAGETQAPGAFQGNLRAYPRGRGGNASARRISRKSPGLSPRTRGKQSAFYDLRIPFGPIPADAGETLVRPCDALTLGAYPRGRGGNNVVTSMTRASGGLSPRTRGKRRTEGCAPTKPGPVPADAGETQQGRTPTRPGGAYPRGRGGNPMPDQAPGGFEGLSPRTRGKLGRGRDRRAGRGRIPADAGETQHRSIRPRSGRAYPRGRGGNRDNYEGYCTIQGLSPRTRGKRRPAARWCRLIRPIPADAGETALPHEAEPLGWAYPRGRGGNDGTRGVTTVINGLSPRTRGKRRLLPVRCADTGPIPADAGETPNATRKPRAPRAYPRGRGGNAPAPSLTLNPLGLSPRTRGKQIDQRVQLAQQGPIPADAGETTITTTTPRRRRAYPRGRGGNLLLLASRTRSWGLSPRTRGKHERAGVPRLDLGPIPADAGETRWESRSFAGVRAYPRGRGGNCGCEAGGWVMRGLSPRTRGKLGGAVGQADHPGPIPADAGETPDTDHRPAGHWAYPRGRGGNAG